MLHFLQQISEDVPGSEGMLAMMAAAASGRPVSMEKDGWLPQFVAATDPYPP